MPPNVYANGNSIACKASLDKTIVPPSDVCLSPPSPPAGPVPVPYPNASFSKDTKSGSKNVKIGNKPVMLKNKSYYKSSPLGNEAATRSFGAGLVSHQITGKTFFAAWSMDVKIEGQNVDRHMDITQSNSSNPGNTAGPNTNAVVWGEIEDEVDMCVCCQAKPRHSQGKAMSMDDWYTKDSSGKDAPHKDEYEQLMKDVNDRKSASPPCTCDSKLVSEEPCNVFRRPVSDAEFQQIKKDWKYVRKEYQEIEGIPS